jgi:hypothetical protein
MAEISLPHTIISRKEAIERNLARYFTGLPCKRGHIAWRETDSSTCAECRSLYKKVRPPRKKTARSRKNLVHPGQKYGLWTVVAEAEPRHYPSRIGGSTILYRMWLCHCECGVEKPVAECSLRNGQSISCGCQKHERDRKRYTVHGEAKHLAGGKPTPEYTAWQQMQDRCHNPNRDGFERYGGRGITVCPEWRASFQTFLADMGRRPSAKHSLDRKDNDKGYSKDNCHWATHEVQMANRRCTRFVFVEGKRVPLSFLAKQYGLAYPVLAHRLEHGWPLEKALTTTVRSTRKHVRKRKREVAA